jgi:hypothetical protein
LFALRGTAVTRKTGKHRLRLKFRFRLRLSLPEI